MASIYTPTDEVAGAMQMASQAASGGGPASQMAAANLAAGPNIDAITKLVNEINQQSWLSTPGRQQALDAITNQLAGNLDPQTIQSAQMKSAEQFGGRGGFATDAGAWQSAVQRALGLGREELKQRGISNLGTLYQGMPVASAEDYTYTPQTWNQWVNIGNQHAEAMASLAENMRQFDSSLAENQRQFTQSLAEKSAEFYASLAEQKRSTDLAASQEAARLAEQASEFANTLSSRRYEFDASAQSQASQYASTLAENMRQFNNSLSQSTGQFSQNLAQQESQYSRSLAEQQASRQATTEQQWNQLYAQMYGTLPLYSSTGTVNRSVLQSLTPSQVTSMYGGGSAASTPTSQAAAYAQNYGLQYDKSGNAYTTSPITNMPSYFGTREQDTDVEQWNNQMAPITGQYKYKSTDTGDTSLNATNRMYNSTIASYAGTQSRANEVMGASGDALAVNQYLNRL